MHTAYRRGRRAAAAALLASLAIAPRLAAADEGFQLERYEPSSAGSWFFGAPHPWYSSARYVAAGLTLDYGHNVLLGGRITGDGSFERTTQIVQGQIVGHVDVAGAFLERVQVAASLPVVLLERGTAAYGVAPVESPVVGDPRLSVMVRLWRHAESDPISLHAAAYVWIPVGAADHHAGDPNARGMPEIIAGGFALGHLRWTAAAGLLIRATTELGHGPASSIGSELQLRAGVGWSDSKRRFNVGPEAWLQTPITGNNAASPKATSLELLAGAQWNIARKVQIGLAVGSGVISTLGTPDLRVIFRVAYAPIRQLRPGDTDGDGVADAEDLCPNQEGMPSRIGRSNGCPDEDADGVPDAEDLCPRVAAGPHGSRKAAGCPSEDRDDDGIADAEDLCPDKGSGTAPDPRARGCPLPDLDSDGIPDAEDLCPNAGSGARPDPKKHGCPLPDADADGIPDAEDLCPKVAAAAHPDPKKRGCPLPDADKDGVPDIEDACPNLAGPADPDPRSKKNGCPRIEKASGSTTELRSVLFEKNQWKLLPPSFPVLDEAARLLDAHREVRNIEIAGHADDTGTPDWNLQLSRRRAEAVVKYLIEKGVDKRRLRAVGYGDTRPIGDDRTDEGRAKNRRVEMHVPAADK